MFSNFKFKNQVAEIEAAEKEKMREKCNKIISHGINCFINRQLIYNFPEEIFADAGIMAIGACLLFCFVFASFAVLSMHCFWGGGKRAWRGAMANDTITVFLLVFLWFAWCSFVNPCHPRILCNPPAEHADFDGIENLALVLGGEIASTFDSPEDVKLGSCKVIGFSCLGQLLSCNKLLFISQLCL